MSSDLQLEILQKRRQVELLRRRKKLVEENGIAFYEPFPKQDLFHRAGEYKRRYVRTGNRFGKSTVGATEDISFALGYRPWYPEGDPARYTGIPKHSTKGVIVVHDWDKAHEIFTNEEPGTSQGKLFQFLPKEAIVAKKKGRSGMGISEIVVKSIHGGHSTIHIETVRSFVQNQMGAESSNWDWIHIDEPCPYAMWIALSRGLVDRGGKAWFTCTPITEAWINDYFVPSSRTRESFDNSFVNEEGKTPKWVLTGSSYDNPNVAAEDLEAFEDDLTEEEKTCRILGIPLALSGLVYKDFKPDVHVYHEAPHGWVDAATPPQNYTIRTFIDPHPRTAHAVLHFATDPHGYTFIFRELFRPCLISDLVEHILAQTEGYHVEDYLVDPIAFIENPNTGACMADEFYAHALPVVPAPKNLQYGIIKTQKAFRERDAHGNPYIKVHAHCEEFLHEIDRYIWNKDTEKPVDKDDHMMECLYRAVLTGLTYVDPDETRSAHTPLEVTQQAWQGPSLRELTDIAPTRDRTKKIFSQRYR